MLQAQVSRIPHTTSDDPSSPDGEAQGLSRALTCASGILSTTSTDSVIYGVDCDGVISALKKRPQRDVDRRHRLTAALDQPTQYAEAAISSIMIAKMTAEACEVTSAHNVLSSDYDKKSRVTTKLNDICDLAAKDLVRKSQTPAELLQTDQRFSIEALQRIDGAAVITRVGCRITDHKSEALRVIASHDARMAAANASTCSIGVSLCLQGDTNGTVAAQARNE